MLVTAMFYTREEQNKRVGYWCEYSICLKAGALTL